MDRDRAKDLLPDWVTERLDADAADAVAALVASDADLAEEARVLRALAEGRPSMPAELGARLGAAVRQGDLVRPARARRRVAPWGLAAAAMAVLALGTTLLVEHGAQGGQDPVEVALEQAPTPWGMDDGLVAGAPVFNDLSDEALESLLQELGG